MVQDVKPKVEDQDVKIKLEAESNELPPEFFTLKSDRYSYDKLSELERQNKDMANTIATYEAQMRKSDADLRAITEDRDARAAEIRALQEDVQKSRIEREHIVSVHDEASSTVQARLVELNAALEAEKQTVASLRSNLVPMKAGIATARQVDVNLKLIKDCNDKESRLKTLQNRLSQRGQEMSLLRAKNTTLLTEHEKLKVLFAAQADEMARLTLLRAKNTTLLTEHEKLKVHFAAQADEMARLRQRLGAHRADHATPDPRRSETNSTDLEARTRWQDKVDDLRAALDGAQSTNIALQTELDKRTRHADSVAKLIADNLQLKNALAANQELSKKRVSEACAARQERDAMEQRVQEMEGRVQSVVATRVILSEKLKLTEKRCAGLEKQRKAPSDDTSSPRRQRQRTSTTLDSPEKVVDLTQDVIDLTLDDGDFYHLHNEPWDVQNNQHFIAWLRHSVLEDAFTLAAATDKLRRTKWAKVNAAGVITGYMVPRSSAYFRYGTFTSLVVENLFKTKL